MSLTHSRFTASFRANRHGGISLSFALTATILAGITGGAIDFARWHNAKRTTTAALDAAVLAGARTLQLNPNDAAGAIATAQVVYATNIAGRIQLETDTVTFVTADSNTAVTATGTATLKTTLLGITGIASLPVLSGTAASFPKASIASGGRGGSHIELAVMLDVTGSMCDDNIGPCATGTKLDGLRAAAKDLVDIVVSNDQSAYTSKVALVPFSTRVRVGPDGGGAAMMTSLTNLDATWSGWLNDCTQSSGSGGSEGGGNWTCQQYTPTQFSNWKVMPCVTDRYFNSTDTYDVTDNAPGAGRWLNAHDGGREILSKDSSDTALTSETGAAAADPADHWNFNSSGECADVDQANQVMPLPANKSALASRIDGLKGYGATAGALGTAWSWYMLSPNWSSIWTGASQPRPYSDVTTIQANGQPVVRKVAVLMTDGGYNTYRGWKDSDQQQVSTWAVALCTNMKAAGVEIYTVGFALDQLTTNERTIARTTLQACGTDIQHFYETLTVPELKAAFQDIAVQMSSLRLSR